MNKNASGGFPYLSIALFAVLLYVGIAWMVFQWQNPKSNEMSLYRHFWSVVTLEKLEKYQ
jgi:lipoprotein signal peptidase